MKSMTKLMAAVVLVSGACVFGQPASKDGAYNGSGSPSVILTRPTQKPPAVPPVKIVPIDNVLREKAKSTLDGFAKDANPVVRANVIEAAQKTYGAEGARAIVLAGLSDEMPVVKFAALIASGDLKYGDVKPIALKLAYDKDPNVRLAARYALHKLGDTTLTQEMLVGLKDDRQGVRANTVMLLGMLGEKSAIPIVKKMYKDSMANVRLQAAEALWRLGDPEAVDELVIWSVSQNGSDQVIALIALAEPKNIQVIEHIRGKMAAQDFPEVELAAARAAGMLGLDDGLGIALKYADSKDARQRGMVAMAMGEIGRADMQPQLAKLLVDSAPEVRLSAATAVLKLKDRGGAAAAGN